MKAWSRKLRGATEKAVEIVSTASALVGVMALFWILYEVLRKGAGALNVSFFTKLPAPPGVEGGGVVNAIVGTALMTALATLMGVTIGVFAGVFLAEFGKGMKTADAVRFSANVLMGIPSIIVGVFVYTFMVLPVGHFSGYAGAVALAIIMLPVTARTTEDIMSLVPNELRESALAMGAPRWRVIFDVVFRSAKTGLLTGVLLAVARVSGETAPLLFTALNSPYFPKSLNEPTANLTVTIFNYAMSPYEDWQRTAWGASLLIMVGVLVVNITARFIFKGAKKS